MNVRLCTVAALLALAAGSARAGQPLETESARRPAFALAGEVKLPTAKEHRIGSGKTDFTLWAIASKRAGAWDTHANLGFTIVGHPAGVAVQNVLNYGLAEEWHVRPRWDVLAEVFGSTAALAEAGAEGQPANGESALTPEIGGAETVGALGARFRPASNWTASLGLSLDSKNALLLHPGIAFTF